MKLSFFMQFVGVEKIALLVIVDVVLFLVMD